MKKLLIGGLLAGVAIVIIGMIFGAMSSELYKMSPKILWKPMGGDWFTKIVIFDIVSGLVLAYVYSLIKGAVPGEGFMKGISFGLIMFVVGPMLGLTMTYLTMAVRTKLVAIWSLNDLINYLVAGIIFEIIDKKIS